MNCEYGSLRENEKYQRTATKPFWKQIFLSSAACNLGFTLGMSTGANTVAIPQMIKENIEVSDEIRSWLGSVFGFGSIFWLLLLTPIVHQCGVKKSYLMICAAPLIGSTIIYFAQSATQFLCGQAIQSIMQTSMTSVTPIVLTEYTSPRNRNLALFLKTASVFWGIWVANIIGTFFYWRYIPAVIWICSLYGMTVFFWPESPFWLASKGRMDECADSFRWARGITEETELELRNFIEFHKTNRDKTKKSLRENIKTYYKWIISKDFYMRMVLNLLICFLYMFSGKTVCTFYAIEILGGLTSDTKWVYYSMLILDGVNVIAMYCGSYLSKKYSQRKSLFILSGVGITCLYLLSVHNFLVKYNVIENDFRVTLVILILYSLSICTGPILLSPALMGDLFPIKNRLLFVNLCTVVNQTIYGIVLKLAPFMFKWGLNVTFLIYACLASIAWVSLFLVLPETQGKTSVEIHENLNNCKIKNNVNSKLLA